MKPRPPPLEYARPSTPAAYGRTGLERVLPQLIALALLGGLLVIGHVVRGLAAAAWALVGLRGNRR